MIKRHVFWKIVFLISSIFLITGCGAMRDYTRMDVGGYTSENVVDGSAGEAGSKGSVQLVKCDQFLGTVVLGNDTPPNPYAMATYNAAASPNPQMVLRLIMQQSGCFQVVDRNAGLSTTLRDQDLRQKGLLDEKSSGNSASLMGADYTITPSVIFSNNNAGGMDIWSIGMLWGNPAGLGGGGASSKNMEAQVILLLIDNRTGLQVAAAAGSASKRDLSLGAGLLGVGSGAMGGLGLGGGQNTDQAKIVVAAFLHAFNNIIPQMPKPDLVKKASVN